MRRRRDYGEYGREGGYENRRSGYGYRRSSSGGYSYQRRERRSEERQVELASFGLLLAAFLIGLVVHLSPETIATVGGAILVGAAIFQWQRRWRVNPLTWIGGAIMLGGGGYALYEHGTVPGGILFPISIFLLVIIASAVTGEF